MAVRSTGSATTTSSSRAGKRGFAIGVVTAVLGGSTVALAVGAITGAPLVVDIAVGAVTAVAIVPALMAYSRRHYGMAPSLDEPLYPTPGG